MDELDEVTDPEIDVKLKRHARFGTIHLTATLVLYTWRIFLHVRKILIIHFAKNCPVPLRNYLTAEEYQKMRNNKRAAVSSRLLMQAISLAVIMAKLTTDYNKFVWELTALYSTELSHRAILFPVLDSLITSCVKGPIKICQFFVLNLPYGYTAKGFFLSGATEAFRDVLLTGAWSTLVVHLADVAGRNGYWIVFAVFNLLKLTWMLVYVYLLEFIWCVPLGNDELGIALKDLSESLHNSRRSIILLDPHKDAPIEVVYVGFPGSEVIIVSSTLMEIMSTEEIQGLVSHTMAHIVSLDSRTRLVFTLVRMFVYLATWVSSYNNASMKRMVGLANKELHPFVVSHLVLDLILPTYLDSIKGTEHIIMRRREFAADDFAVKNGFGIALRSGLLKLAALNDLDPVFDSWYSAWFYGLGTAVERANRIESSSPQRPASWDEPREQPAKIEKSTDTSKKSSNKSSRRPGQPSNKSHQEPPEEEDTYRD